MREGVTYKRLGDVASYVNGYAFKPETWTDHGLPIVRIQNLNKPDAEYNYFAGELPTKFIINDGDLLISWSASLGAYIWNGGRAYLNQHIFKVVFDKSDIDKSYLKYAVESKLLEMKRNVHGSTMQHIVKGDFDNTKIPVPSLDEQQRIVSELDRLASIISDKQQQVRELDNLALALFTQMFDISKYESKQLEKLTSVFVDGDWIESKDQSDEGIRLVQTGNVGNGFFKAKDERARYISQATFDRLGCTEIYEGDCLVSRLPDPIGRACVLPNIGERTITAVDCTIIRFKKDILPLFFVYYSMTEKYQNIIIKYSTGTTRKRISRKNLGSVPVPVPPLDLQKQFAEKVKTIEEQKDVLKQSIAEFENLLAQRMELHFA